MRRPGVLLGALMAALLCATTLGVVGSAPAQAQARQFRWRDYRYVLTENCFCFPGSPVRITVRHGVVVRAVYTASDGQHQAGDPAGARMRRTIADLLQIARSGNVDRAVIRWPADRPAPSEIDLDYNRRIADDEVQYHLSVPVRLRSS